MSEEEIQRLEEKIQQGEFKPAETLILKSLKLKKASEEAKQNFGKQLNTPTLYAYAASLEQRIETLEQLVKTLMCLLG